MELRNRRWSNDEFFNIRKEVLSQWHTGSSINLEEAVEYCRRLPPGRNWRTAQEAAAKQGRMLIGPHVGRATTEEMIDVIQSAGDLADYWSLITDPYTRKTRFEAAQKALESSRREGKSLISGYPIVNHGVQETRRLTESTNSQMILVACDEDPRLSAEVAFASGFSRTQSHTLHELVQHSRDYPLEKKIQNMQYISRLAGYYTEHGFSITVGGVANLTGWAAPGMKIAFGILDSLLAVEQGVKNVLVDESQTMNFVQDIAALRTNMKLLRHYLDQFGFQDVPTAVCGYPWQGDWPRDKECVAGLTALNVATGILAGVNCYLLRSLDEPFSHATKEGIIGVLKIAKQMARTLAGQKLVDSGDVKQEQEMVEKEVRAVVDKVLELGKGDVAIGMIKAVESGVLDVVFSSWRPLKGEVVTVRDKAGAIRYLKHGNVPLPNDVIKYHQEKIAETKKAQGVQKDFELVASSVTYTSKPLQG